MAKETAKSSLKKAAKKKKMPVGKKKAGKPAPKTPVKKGKAAGTGASAKKAGLEPRRVTTGGGANSEQIGRSLVELFNAGKFGEVEAKWWSPRIESIEGFGMAWAGRAAVEAKNAGWIEENEIVGAAAEGPYVGATGFSVKFRMEVRERATGKQVRMEEVGVYTVEGGKIVREEFMYGAAQPVADAAGPSAQGA